MGLFSKSSTKEILNVKKEITNILRAGNKYVNKQENVLNNLSNEAAALSNHVTKRKEAIADMQHGFTQNRALKQLKEHASSKLPDIINRRTAASKPAMVKFGMPQLNAAMRGKGALYHRHMDMLTKIYGFQGTVLGSASGFLSSAYGDDPSMLRILGFTFAGGVAGKFAGHKVMAPYMYRKLLPSAEKFNKINGKVGALTKNLVGINKNVRSIRKQLA